MTGQELLDYIRVDVLRDNAVPYLWSDALIMRFLVEAENIFARKTYALLDDSQTITTEIGQDVYAIPTGTIFIYSAAISDQSRDLGNFTRRFIPSNLAASTGTPSVFSCDESARTVRFYPVPDAVITVNLRLARLPRTALAVYSSPEIPEEYHLDLAEFVAARCLLSNDVDGQNTKAADRLVAAWLLRLSEAKREYYRFRTGANPNAVSSWTGKRN